MFKQFSIGKYTCTGKIIGSGTFSNVCLGIDTEEQKQVAIKIIKPHFAKKSKKHALQLKRELDIVQKLDHQNITKCLYVCDYLNTKCMVMEYCNGGTLEKYIKQKQGKLSEYISQHLIKQLCNGLEYLHEFGIIHRDLKPDNLLIHYETIEDPVRNKQRKKIILKITDFGLATTEDTAQTQCGSRMYMAPEIFLGKEYSYKADLWSTAAILYRMLSGSPLFKKMPHLSVFESTSKLYYEDKLIKNGTCYYSDNCLDLLRRTLVNDPNKRIDWDSFVNHQFFTVRIMTDPEYKLELTEKELHQLKSITSHDSLYMDCIGTDSFLNKPNITEPLTKKICDNYRIVLSVLKLGDKRSGSSKFDEALVLYRQSVEALHSILSKNSTKIAKNPELKTTLLKRVYKDIFETCTIYLNRIKTITSDSQPPNISFTIIKYIQFCCKKTEIMAKLGDYSRLNKKINMCLNCLDFLEIFVNISDTDTLSNLDCTISMKNKSTKLLINYYRKIMLSRKHMIP